MDVIALLESRIEELKNRVDKMEQVGGRYMITKRTLELNQEILKRVNGGEFTSKKA